MINISNSKKGYTLVEALIYIAIFVVMSSVMVSLILLILETNRQVAPLNSLSRGAISTLEIISREIRNASSIDTVGSVMGTSTGSLKINTFDQRGSPKTIKFYLDLGVIKLAENDIYLGPLTTDDVVANSLFFDLATSTNQNLIRIEMDLTAGSGKHQKNERFYSSTKLRVDN